MRYGLRLFFLVLIVAVNAFFALSEVALLSVRSSRLRQLAEEGGPGAQAALNLLANPERLLSVTQVGVTLASLGLGWVGETTLYELITGWFRPSLTPLASRMVHLVSFAAAFSIITFFHVVMGEVVPKNFAIENADRLAVRVAPALLLFYRVSGAFVYLVEKSSAAISRALGLRAGQRGGGHSAEELKLILSASRTRGFLPPAQIDMMHRALDLDRLSVREIMVPRNDIVSISVNATLDQVLRTIIDQQHSRLPVYEGRPEQMIGILHHKDLLRVWADLRSGRPVPPFHLRRLMRKYLVVPETKPIIQMLEAFKQGRSHMAMVVDEFGTIVGLVTVEDVLEEIVGAIEDEYDEWGEHPAIEAPQLELDGATKIRDLETQYGIEIPTDVGFETLAGFLLSRLGYIPNAGDIVEQDGRRYTVLEMERNRIAKVRIERIAA